MKEQVGVTTTTETHLLHLLLHLNSQLPVQETYLMALSWKLGFQEIIGLAMLMEFLQITFISIVSQLQSYIMQGEQVNQYVALKIKNYIR